MCNGVIHIVDRLETYGKLVNYDSIVNSLKFGYIISYFLLPIIVILIIIMICRWIIKRILKKIKRDKNKKRANVNKTDKNSNNS